MANTISLEEDLLTELVDDKLKAYAHHKKTSLKYEIKKDSIQEFLDSKISLWINDSTNKEPDNVLKHLTKIFYNNKKLKKLPNNISELIRLEELDLGNNLLTSLPETIGALTSLKTLFLYNNLLTSLPENIGNLTSLKSLFLYNNKLSSLPESINKLVNTDIYVKHNAFSQLSKSVLNNEETDRNYLLVNPSTVLICKQDNFLYGTYRVKPVSEILDTENVNTYLDLCIEKGWTVKPEMSLHAYKIITGQEIKLPEYCKKIQEKPELKKLLLTTNKELLDKKGIINPEIDTKIIIGNYGIIL